MAVIKFTAVNRGELPSWLTAGATFYLANNFQGFPRRLVAKGQREETLDGTPEGYLHALQREYSIVTDFIPLAERDLWRAFFASVLNTEGFQIDFDARQLLGNPSFESGALSPWSAAAGGTPVANTTAAIIGTYGAQLTLAINAQGNILESALAPTIASASHVYQMLARRSETSVPNRNLAMFNRFSDSGGGSLSTSVIATVLAATSGVQMLQGTSTSVASTAQCSLGVQKVSPHATDETGVWHVDHALLARLSSWVDVWLIDSSIEEQQIGGVGVQYRFRVKALP